MKIIYDKVLGDIPMTDLEISILDTPMYHRMSYIKQTSMAYRVFPTATFLTPDNYMSVVSQIFYIFFIGFWMPEHTIQ